MEAVPYFRTRARAEIPARSGYSEEVEEAPNSTETCRS